MTGARGVAHGVTTTPQIQPLGSALLLQGPVLAELRWALFVGTSVIKSRDGVELASLTALKSALNRAIAASGNAAMGEDADLEDSSSDACGTDEAAGLLGLQPRQVRNIHGRLGGRKVGQTWVFDRSAVQAEAVRRREEEP